MTPMNKSLIVLIVVASLVLGGGGLFIVSQRSSTTEVAKEAVEKKNNSTPGSEQNKMVENDSVSRYLEYSDSALDETKNKRRVLYFYASWCPTCRPTDADLKANESKIPEDTVVIRVNYNDPDTDSQEKDLAKKYGITYQHTFVQIDAQGKEIARWSSGQTDELLTNLK